VADARVVVVGAGVGGLAAALELAARGLDVTVLESAAGPGGKMRAVEPAPGMAVDAGPTVLTMRWVFEALFEAAGLSFADRVPTRRATVLARHAWDGDPARLDLHAGLPDSAAAIGDFSGTAEARRFLDFMRRAAGIYRTLEDPFLRRACDSPLALVRAVGLSRLRELWDITPFSTLWGALGRHFHDPRLRQLFGRYATYCGSSPFLAPATLMLVAHVEQDGVWFVDGGMHRLAQALAEAARARGAVLRFGAEVAEVRAAQGRVAGVTLRDGERLDADAVVVNADAAAVAGGLFGDAARRAAPTPRGARRSLSALTWLLAAPTAGFPLARHNVFFSRDYAREFARIFGRGEAPDAPTIYVCAQDRDAAAPPPEGAPERLLVLMNAPADGDARRWDPTETLPCESRTFDLLARCGLMVDRQPESTRLATPADFHRLFPGTGGALYGAASHGWRASFQRPGARTRLPGLYLAGGSTHPGPGVPMAALSGRIAAGRLLADLASTARSRTAVMPGGTSMP
jgi:1-hydroxycarotenoid 3,4-desaturase